MANNNNTKNLNVPNLRFPEFSGEWKKCKLGDLCNVLMCKRILVSQTNTEDGVPFYKIGTIGSTPDAYISKELFDDYKVKYNYPRKGEVMITCAGTVGKCVVYDGEDAYFQDSNIVWIDNPTQYISNGFLFHLLSKVDWRKLNSTTIIRIYNDDLRNLKMSYPRKEEQQKISHLLSLLDERIATQNKIIEKYESLIKGIGNKLFSFKMRFKTNDGNDFPSWKTKSFENIGKTFSGLSGKAKEDFGIGKPYIQYKQVFDTPQIQIQNCGLVNVLDSENQNNVKYGDILFTVSSETPDEIGMSSVLLDEVDEMYLNSFCFGYRLSSFEVLNPLYASYFFRDSSFRNKVVKIAQGSTRYNISKSEFIKLKISLPCIEEQARIASFLSAVDEKIKEEKEILALYLIQKNHLLRQMVSVQF